MMGGLPHPPMEREVTLIMPIQILQDPLFPCHWLYLDVPPG